MNRLDEFVKDKLVQREFEVDKNDWLQAVEMIDARQKRRRKFFWIWFLSGQVLVLALAFFLWPAVLPDNPDTRETLSGALVQNNEPPASQSLVDPGRTPDQKAGAASAGTPNTSTSPKIATIPPATPIAELNRVRPKSFEEVVVTKKETQNTTAALVKVKDRSPEADAATVDIATNTDEQVSQLSKVDQTEMKFSAFRTPALAMVPLLDPEVSGENRAMNYAQKVLGSSPVFNHKIGVVLASTFYPYAGMSEKQYIGFVGGVVYTKSVNSFLNFELGLNYRKRIGTFSEGATSEQTTYAFSRSVARFYTLPENMHFIELPLAIQFVKNRHRLSLGVTGSYLLGLRGTLNKEGYGESFPEGGDSEVLSRGWVPVSGVKTLHWDVFTSWYLAVNPEMSLGVKINYSVGTLMEAPNNGIYLESKPLFFDVGFRYNLFK
jgi:cytoskeletal protein RodZ